MRRKKGLPNRALARLVVAAQLLLSGCAANAPLQPQAFTPTVPLPRARPTVTQTVTPSATPAAQSATLTLPATATTEEPFTVCSPLEGIAVDELNQPDMLKNPFEMPRPGMDDGHHGADFAYWTRGERTTMQGLPVYAVLPGTVAGVIYNRLPYGNAVIVETALSALPEGYTSVLDVSVPQPTVQAAPSLYCPEDERVYGDPNNRSLYLLYAHLDQTPTLAVGDAVACGGPIGEVGTTGKSVNFHLHLEARAGPSGSTFPSFAHYDTAATAEEMSAYCTWRVSGLFQMFDPLLLFPSITPQPSLQP